MTQAEKEAILSLRQQQYSFSAIAETTGLPLGTIKSFLSRVSGKKETPDPAPRVTVSQCAASSVAHHWNRPGTARPSPSVMTGAVASIGTSTGICPGGLQRINRPARFAVVHSSPTMDGTAPVPVMGWPGHRRLVWLVNKDIIGYCSAIAQARRMLKMGIISLDDYEKIDHALLENINCLYRVYTVI